jgi:hypothetical protein
MTMTLDALTARQLASGVLPFSRRGKPVSTVLLQGPLPERRRSIPAAERLFDAHQTWKNYALFMIIDTKDYKSGPRCAC